MTARLVLHVGRTTLTAAVVAEDQAVIEEAVSRIPPGVDAESLYGAALFVLEAAVAAGGVPVAAVGVGCRGPVQWPGGDVSPRDVPAWRDFPLRDRLATDLGLPVRLSSDAVCLTIGEFLLGRSTGDCLGLLVGTEVASALIVDGRLVGGSAGNAGRIGHVVVQPDGPDCRCGGRGCLETVCRGPALVSWAQQQGWRPPSHRGADTVALAESARAGDPVAAAAFRRGGAALGIALASVGSLLDLRRVAIGGGVSRAADLLMPAVYESFERHAGPAQVRRCRVVLAAPEAELVGAAALFDDRWWPVVEDLARQRSATAADGLATRSL